MPVNVLEDEIFNEQSSIEEFNKLFAKVEANLAMNFQSKLILQKITVE